MPATTPCIPCCTTPQVTNVPGGQGLSGSNGTDGENAFAYLAVDSALPAAAGNPVTFSVTNTGWMVVGQIVMIGQGGGTALANPGPGTFEITAIGSSTSFTGNWLDYSTDAAALSPLSAGCIISPAGGNITVPLALTGGGTGVSVATIDALLTALGLTSSVNAPYFEVGSGANFDAGASQPNTVSVVMGSGLVGIIITIPGTYLLFGSIQFYANGLNLAAARTLTAQIYRSNNTPGAQITHTRLEAATGGAVTKTLADIMLPPILYTTANVDDALDLQAGINGAIAGGTFEVSAGTVIAIKLY